MVKQRLVVLPPQPEDIWARIDRRGPEECWAYAGWRDRRGYGHFKGWLAHRLAWVLVHGPIPDGLNICHHCDNPPCCNPTHLFSGTTSGNHADCLKKGRHRLRRYFSPPLNGLPVGAQMLGAVGYRRRVRATKAGSYSVGFPGPLAEFPDPHPVHVYVYRLAHPDGWLMTTSPIDDTLVEEGW